MPARPCLDVLAVQDGSLSPVTDPRAQLMLFDFDGTLCLGDDPVLAYAVAVEDRLRARGESTALRDNVRHALNSDDLNSDDLGIVPGGAAETATPQDGYQLVQALGQAAGLDEAECSAAFRAARAQLIAGGLHRTDVHTPAGVQSLLAELRQSAAVVLVTNAPAEGFSLWLEALGLSAAFDAVINDAAKPAGMPAAVTRARSLTGISDSSPVLSIGDIWANDLAPVAELGGTTVLIDRHAAGAGSPDHRVRSFAEAAPLLRQWVQNPR